MWLDGWMALPVPRTKRKWTENKLNPLFKNYLRNDYLRTDYLRTDYSK